MAFDKSSETLTMLLKCESVKLHIKTGIQIIQKWFVYTCKVAFKSLKTFLVCQFLNAHCSVCFYIKTLSC